MRRNRGEIQVFSISFLDVLSCALGAVLILLVVVPTSPPKPEVKLKVIQKLKAIIASITTENKSFEQQIAELKDQNERLEEQNNRITSQKPKTIPQPAKKPTPSLFGLPLKADHAIFVVDVSGSMSWQVVNLYNTIESLLLSCDVERYRFIFFDSYVYSSGRYWRHDWLRGNEANKESTLREIKQNLADYILEKPMGTNSGDALYEALQFKQSDVIYFLTDGYPTVGETNVQKILSRIRYNNTQNSTINCIMVGLPGTNINRYGNVIFDKGANPKELYEFLHTLAEQNNGVYVGR